MISPTAGMMVGCGLPVVVLLACYFWARSEFIEAVRAADAEANNRD
jgi:hypothetical protein